MKAGWYGFVEYGEFSFYFMTIPIISTIFFHHYNVMSHSYRLLDVILYLYAYFEETTVDEQYLNRLLIKYLHATSCADVVRSHCTS